MEAVKNRSQQILVIHCVEDAMSALEPSQGHQIAFVFCLLQARLLHAFAEGVQDLAPCLWVDGAHSGTKPVGE
eukprot:15443661-Alexandrium_andersonii.AAC.1